MGEQGGGSGKQIDHIVASYYITILKYFLHSVHSRLALTARMWIRIRIKILPGSGSAINILPGSRLNLVRINIPGWRRANSVSFYCTQGCGAGANDFFLFWSEPEPLDFFTYEVKSRSQSTVFHSRRRRSLWKCYSQKQEDRPAPQPRQYKCNGIIIMNF